MAELTVNTFLEPFLNMLNRYNNPIILKYKDDIDALCPTNSVP